jgi:hypothetical protein
MRRHPTDCTSILVTVLMMRVINTTRYVCATPLSISTRKMALLCPLSSFIIRHISTVVLPYTRMSMSASPYLSHVCVNVSVQRTALLPFPPPAACLPRAGFVAYPDSTDGSVSPSSTRPDLCPAELYTTCLNDPSCTGFDTLRNLYDSTLNPGNVYNGMCTYKRMLWGPQDPS